MSKLINRNNYYVQTNNPTEVALRSYGAKAWLVSCGPTTAINCLAVLGYPVDVLSPSGNWKFQPEELLMDFLIDPRNVPKLNAIRDLPADFSKQEVPQYYPYAVSVLYGATARFEFVKNWDTVCGYIMNGETVQLCLKKPGHYVAAVDFVHGPHGGTILYNDSWPNRHEDGNGYLVEMDKSEYDENVKNFIIRYLPMGGGRHD